MDIQGKFALFARKMEAEGLPALVIDTFRFYYDQVIAGSTGYIGEDEITPLSSSDLPAYESLPGVTQQALQGLLACTAIIKLNGGLGTTMRLQGAKSAIPVKNGLTFLDITARQVLALRSAHGASVPLILMNSFSTHEESLDLLASYPTLAGDLPSSFLQHKFPKVIRETLGPADSPSDRRLEWNPPGHGDLYTALVTSGLLDRMLDKGLRFAFVSNIDNLGGTLDLRILDFFSRGKTAFLMEVAQRTTVDSKGGHLARRRDGRLTLREYAQCPPQETALFQDIRRYGCFNTNNLWINLEALGTLLHSCGGVPGLPLIRNEKHLNPLDETSPRVYQLETAMGSAIYLFEKSAALVVPRRRFIPVKKCDDLLCVQSDCYGIDGSYSLVRNNHRHGGPTAVRLDPVYFGNVETLAKRFSFGPPSLAECGALVVEGDIFFGKGITIRGRHVRITNRRSCPVTIPDFMVVDQDLVFNA